MNDQFVKDRMNRPDLFDLFGTIAAEDLDEWLREREYVVPDDLRQFWMETGGGDLFESETVLGPFGNQVLSDDVDGVNEVNWEKGMSPTYLIFHTGIGLSIVDMSTGHYANIREHTYEINRRFQSVADWYVDFIRCEFAARYGLA